jgi:hypothetical protein
MKPKYKVGQEVIVIKQKPLSVKKLLIGGILIDEDGTFYFDGANYGPEHRYREDFTFKTEKEAMEKCSILIEVEVEKFRTDLIQQIAGGK